MASEGLELDSWLSDLGQSGHASALSLTTCKMGVRRLEATLLWGVIETLPRVMPRTGQATQWVHGNFGPLTSCLLGGVRPDLAASLYSRT